MTDWLKRPYDPETDHDAIVALWLRSYSLSPYGKRVEHYDRLRYVVSWLLNSGVAKTEVICDPEHPEIIWAFACTTGENIVHYTVVKNSAVRLGLSAEMLRELLGDRLDRRCHYTFDPAEFLPSRCEEHKVDRPDWRPDLLWLALNLT